MNDMAISKKKTGVFLVFDKTAQVLKGLVSIEKFDVLVGIPAEKTPRSNEDKGNLNNAQLGYIHENGAPEANIPARPFLMPGVRESTPKFMPHMKKAALAASEGDRAKTEKHLNAAGLIATNAVRRRINQGTGFAPLAASTIAARKRRGRSGIKPLIDTAQLRNSITYVVRKDK